MLCADGFGGSGGGSCGGHVSVSFVLSLLRYTPVVGELLAFGVHFLLRKAKT